MRKILYATDFSDCCHAALAMASSLARDSGATLVIAHVHEPAFAYTEGLGAAYSTLPDQERRDAQQLLDAVQPTLPDVACERCLLEGTPAHAIVEFAEQAEDIDMIVLGTHGRTGISRALMGSIAEEVVRNAPCPVLTLKEPVKQSK